MNELVFIENDRPVTDSLTVATVFGKNHADVLRDVRRTLAEVDAEWGISNFAETPYTHPQNGQTYTKYVMTEDGFTLLVMGYTGREAMQFKVRYIQEFRRMQSELQSRKLINQFNLPRSYPEALRALAEASELNEAMQKQLEEQAPKVLFADAVTTSHTSILVRELAILLRQNGIDIGEKRLFDQLRERGYLIKRKGTDWNMPTQKAMDLGLFEVKETPIHHNTGSVSVSKTPKVTGKGQVYFVNLFKKQQQLVGQQI